MLNEFIYCQRLFHMEWVQSRFEDSADTVEGRYVHRAVDQEVGAAPLPDDDRPFKEARSLWLTSERLGLTAKIDIVEGDGDMVRPVEVKRGSPPPHGPAWEPEMVQLCSQGLLLVDHGYKCDSGAFYYAQSRQKIDVPFDEQLLSKTLHYLAGLRDVAAQEDSPPPLIDSPKCPRCSLVGICLPDEVNTLNLRTKKPARRLTPRDKESRPMYVTEQGASVGLRDNRIMVSHAKGTLAEARIIDVSHIALYGNAQMSSQLMRRCFDEDISVMWFSYGGWFTGIAEGLPAKNVDLRIRQAGRSTQSGLPIAQKVVEGKIRNSRVLLRRNGRGDTAEVVAQLKTLAVQASTAESIPSLLGYEGTAARLYFGAFTSMLREDRKYLFDFERRSRRPPVDRINCLLSFTYGLLVKDLTATAIAVGLDPYIGFFHRPRFGRPALSLDLAEEFRPLIAESVVLNLINNGEVSKSDFVERAGGVALTPDGRKAVIRAYERRLDDTIAHPLFKYIVPYRRMLEVQTRLLAAFLMGEVDSYTPLLTR
jgi:CRISP-associated protein Cas1